MEFAAPNVPAVPLAEPNHSSNISSYELGASHNVDSGYQSINNSTAVGHSSSACTSSINISQAFEPIPPAIYTVSSSYGGPETPTTSYNIDKISAFHITSPTITLASPGKRCAQRILDVTPSKSRRLTYQPALKPISASMNAFLKHMDNEHSCDDIENSPMEFSPIIGNRSVEKMVKSPRPVLRENHRKFERKLSENTLQSSTPIQYAINGNTQKGNTVAKDTNLSTTKGRISYTQFQRKSSPSSLKRKWQQMDIQMSPANPARKKLSFNVGKFNEFESLTDSKNQEKSQCLDVIKEESEPLNIDASNQNLLLTRKKSEIRDAGVETFPKMFEERFFDLVWLKQSTSQETVMPPPPLTPFAPELSDFELPENVSFDLTVPSMPDTANSSLCLEVTPSPQNNEKRALKKLVRQPNFNQSPTDEPIVQPILTSPTKKSTEPCEFIKPRSPRQERNQILYGELPRTPSKNQCRRLLRRDTSSKLIRSPVTKRSLYAATSNKNYDGYKKLDIITHLARLNVPILDSILKLLPDQDLVNVSMVSRKWRDIVTSNSKVVSRLTQFNSDQRLRKENVPRRSSSISSTHNISIQNTTAKRKPFKACNSVDSNVFANVALPSISPATRAFRENQAIVKMLKPYQTVRKCPLCNSYSIVTHHTKESDLLSTADDSQLPFHRLTRQSSVSIQSLVESDEIIRPDTGQCTNRQCNFQFCIHCFHQYHPDSICPLVAADSEEDDDIEEDLKNVHGTVKGPMMNRSHGRRSLRRLRKLP